MQPAAVEEGVGAQGLRVEARGNHAPVAVGECPEQRIGLQQQRVELRLVVADLG